MICRLREFRREPSALFFVIAFPIVVLLGLQMMQGPSPENSSDEFGSALPVGIVQELWQSPMPRGEMFSGVEGEAGSEVAESSQNSLPFEPQQSAWRTWGEFFSGSDFSLFSFARGSQEELTALLDSQKIAFFVSSLPSSSSPPLSSLPLQQWQYYLPSSPEMDVARMGVKSAVGSSSHGPLWPLAGSIPSFDDGTVYHLARSFHAQVHESLGRLDRVQARYTYASSQRTSLKRSTTASFGGDLGSDQGDGGLFFIPGLLALSLLSTSLFGTGMTVVVHRRESLLKRFLTTPMPRFAYLLSHLIGRQLIMLLEIATILLFGWLIMGFTMIGSWWLLILLCSLGTLTMTFMSLALASRTTQTSFYNSLANLCLLPMMLFGGVWFSTQKLPYWLEQVAYVLPLTPLVSALREVAFEQVGFGDVIPQVAIMAGYGVVFAALAHVLFVWYRN